MVKVISTFQMPCWFVYVLLVHLKFNVDLSVTLYIANFWLFFWVNFIQGKSQSIGLSVITSLKKNSKEILSYE